MQSGTTNKSGSGADTRERILDVAERLFAERGLDAVSVRDITSAAEANLGAINYHFNTKENLISAVLARRMEPLTERRLKALDAAEAAAPNRTPDLETVLEALFRPSIELALDPKNGTASFAKLVARCMIEPNVTVEKEMSRFFEPLVRRMNAVLLRIMPELTPDDILWRMHLIVGALHHSLIMLDRKVGDCRPVRLDMETYVQRFVGFAAAGFRGATQPQTKKKRSTS